MKCSRCNKRPGRAVTAICSICHEEIVLEKREQVARSIKLGRRQPAKTQLGTMERVEILRLRVARGEPLFHPEDTVLPEEPTRKGSEGVREPEAHRSVDSSGPHGRIFRDHLEDELVWSVGGGRV